MKKLRINDGMKVQVSKLFDDTAWMNVHPNYLQTRKKGAVGNVRGQVPEHSGSLWWVDHEDGSTAAYHKNELEQIK
jgi:hypothetical protein